MRRYGPAAIVLAGSAAAALLALLLWTPNLAPPGPPNRGHSIEEILDPPRTVRRTLETACYPCHANGTAWPWYAHIKPFSGTIRRDVADGRAAVNFSTWSTEASADPRWQARTLEAACSLMQAGMMPPNYYSYFHPGRRLRNSDIREFCTWTRGIALQSDGARRP